MIDIKKLEQKRSIVLVSKNDPVELALGSIFYSIALQLHKKVSLLFQENISKRYEKLPWIEKGRYLQKLPQEDTFTMESFLPTSIEELEMFYETLEQNNIKINPKIATAFYALVVVLSDNFSIINGTTFAFAQKVVQKGALVDVVRNYLQKYSTLAQLRLSGAMFLQMELKVDATLALFSVSKTMLEESGAKQNDVIFALQKSLELPTIKRSVVFVENGDNQSVIYFQTLLKEDKIFNIYNLAKLYQNCYTIIENRSIQEMKEDFIQKVREIEKEK